MSDLVGNPEDRFSQNKAHIEHEIPEFCCCSEKDQGIQRNWLWSIFFCFCQINFVLI